MIEVLPTHDAGGRTTGYTVLANGDVELAWDSNRKRAIAKARRNLEAWLQDLDDVAASVV